MWITCTMSHATLESPPDVSLEFRQQPAGDDLKELCPNPRLVVDCGAGAGWFAKNARAIWPDARIVSFEPSSRFNLVLKPIDEKHEIRRLAVGNYGGKATLNLTHSPESNSLLDYLPDGPLCKAHSVVGHEDVFIARLDIQLQNEHVDVLKLDLQGGEKSALEGARELIRRCRPVIYAEVSFQQQYQGQILLPEFDEYMTSLGYRRLHLYSSPMPDIWGDALYVPNDEPTNRISQYVVDTTDAIRLNIGAGSTVIPGFTPIDRKFGTEAYPLNYSDNSVEEIRCVHMLEHLSFGEAIDALREWHRVLKPGGRLRISVPDVHKVVSLSQSDPHWAFYLMGGQTDSNDFHKSAYDEHRLRAYLEQLGFGNVQRWTSTNTDLASSDISLNLEGFKGAEVKSESEQQMKVRAVCGMPRIGWNDAWMSICDAMHPFGIPVETHQGCFWAQNIQKALERAVKDGIDWLITLDYDSMILPKHIARMLEIMGTHPEIDACAALQMRRGTETALMSNGSTEQRVTNWEPVKADTAHFGLTIIRTECLKDVPKPWFIDRPDKDGSYGDTRVDADIHFWQQWTKAGKTVYVAPDVRIGHLELLVSEFDDDLKPRHWHVSQWWNLHAKQGHCMRSKRED